ncbi:MAG: O-antigen ligase family protein [Planctomycetota bacterium]
MSMPDKMTLAGTVQGSGSRQNDKSKRPKAGWGEWFAWPARIILLFMVTAAPWAKGSVNFWAQQYIMLALLICLAFWWFETGMQERKKQIFPYLFFPVLLGICLGAFQLVPLPGWLEGIFLDRQLEIFEEFTGETNPRKTISLNREGTWNQISLLIMAMSALLLGCRYFRSKRDISLLFWVGTLNGVAMTFFAIIHKLTAEYAYIYWVFPISRTEPFGPFVNPNNCAGFLLMCLACAVGLLPIVLSQNRNPNAQRFYYDDMSLPKKAFYQVLELISELDAKKVALLLAITMISFGVVASLSRGGVVALLAGVTMTTLWFGVARRPKRSGILLLPLVLGVVALAGWIGAGDKIIEAFEEIDMADVQNADVRLQIWRDMLPSVADMGPLGAGLGSHKNVHRLYRTQHENALYVYAENQYLQALFEAGIPGLILFMVAWYLFYRTISLMLNKGSSPTTVGVATMGAFLFFSQAIASLFDFGFYIGANMVYLAVLAGFISYHGQSFATRLKEKSWLGFQASNTKIQILVLLIFAAAVLIAMDMNRRARIEALMVPKVKELDLNSFESEELDNRISELTSMLGTQPTVDGLNYLGDLWIHRCRLTLTNETLKRFPDYDLGPDADPEMVAEKNRKRKIREENIWHLSHPQRLHENYVFLRDNGAQIDAQKFINRSAIRDDLNFAKLYFDYSRRESPLQPVAHLRLGMIKALISAPGKADIDFERAMRLAPYNGPFHRLAGFYYLQSGDVQKAAVHFRRVLDLRPNEFERLIKTITGATQAQFLTVPDEIIAEQILPDDPSMLYKFGAYFLPTDSPARNTVFNRACQLIDQKENLIRTDLVLLGNLSDRMGEYDEAADHYESALITQPNDPDTRYKRAQVLEKAGRLEEALVESKTLAKENREKDIYARYQRQLERKIREQKKSQR